MRDETWQWVWDHWFEPAIAAGGDRLEALATFSKIVREAEELE